MSAASRLRGRRRCALPCRADLAAFDADGLVLGLNLFLFLSLGEVVLGLDFLFLLALRERTGDLGIADLALQPQEWCRSPRESAAVSFSAARRRKAARSVDST